MNDKNNQSDMYIHNSIILEHNDVDEILYFASSNC